MNDLLDQLNPQQRVAVTATEGPVLLLAGAGSGKTRVLTYRIAHLVLHHGADPSEILAVTFTNKAADEMRARLRTLLGSAANGLWVSTFHSACVRILRNDIQALGRNRNFVIYDDKEQLDLLHDVVKQLNLDADYYQPRALAATLDKIKNEGLAIDDVTARRLSSFYDPEQALRIVRRYQEDLLRNNALDFGDLLVQTIELFRKVPPILDTYRARIKYILVDEYQDTNRAQYLIVRALSSMYNNLCVVGDDDQSIYSWRGADIRNILDFHHDYPNATVIKLEQNYRSTQTILKAAQRVVEKNRRRTDKTLWTANPPGDPIILYTADDDHDEARWVIACVKDELRRGGHRLKDISVMYRINALSRVFEEALIREKIPYQIVGGMRFYDRKEIKDLLSLMRLLLNPHDGVSFRRSVKAFTRGIGEASLDKIEALARERQCDIVSAASEAAEVGVVVGAAGGKLRTWMQLLQEAREQVSNLGIRELADHLLLKTGYLEALRAEKSEEARSRVENIGQLLSSMQEFAEKTPDASLAAYLDQVALVSDADAVEEADRLTLMTLHAAKGLEFPVVFLVGMEQKIFPSSKSQGDAEQMEEERRLCYVGITRAEKRLYLSHAKRRRLWGEYDTHYPSQFLSDIPRELVKHIQPSRPAWLDVPAKSSPHVIEYEQGYRPRSLSGANPAGSASLASAKVGQFHQGCRVSHPTFGLGLVVYAEGDDSNPKLTVKFERAGVKKIMARFVPLEIVE